MSFVSDYDIFEHKVGSVVWAQDIMNATQVYWPFVVKGYKPAEGLVVLDRCGREKKQRTGKLSSYLNMTKLPEALRKFESEDEHEELNHHYKTPSMAKLRELVETASLHAARIHRKFLSSQKPAHKVLRAGDEITYYPMNHSGRPLRTLIVEIFTKKRTKEVGTGIRLRLQDGNWIDNTALVRKEPVGDDTQMHKLSEFELVPSKAKNIATLTQQLHKRVAASKKRLREMRFSRLEQKEKRTSPKRQKDEEIDATVQAARRLTRSEEQFQAAKKREQEREREKKAKEMTPQAILSRLEQGIDDDESTSMAAPSSSPSAGLSHSAGSSSSSSNGKKGKKHSDELKLSADTAKLLAKLAADDSSDDDELFGLNSGVHAGTKASGMDPVGGTPKDSLSVTEPEDEDEDEDDDEDDLLAPVACLISKKNSSPSGSASSPERTSKSTQRTTRRGKGGTNKGSKDDVFDFDGTSGNDSPPFIKVKKKRKYKRGKPSPSKAAKTTRRSPRKSKSTARRKRR